MTTRGARAGERHDTASAVGIIGGTGPAGSGLALRIAAAGRDVVIGSRDPARAAAAADELESIWPDLGGSLRGASNDAASRARLVVIATPWSPALRMAGDLAPNLAGKIVVSMANALSRSGGQVLPLTMPRGSVAAELQARLPASAVVGAFHHLPASGLRDLSRDSQGDVFVFGDDHDARMSTMDLVEQIRDLHAVDAGTLASAGAVEAMTAVLVHVGISTKAAATLRVVSAVREADHADDQHGFGT